MSLLSPHEQHQLFPDSPQGGLDLAAELESDAMAQSSAWDTPHGKCPLSPMDSHNTRLLDQVHPTNGRADPEVQPLYNMVVLGAGAGGLVTAASATMHPLRPHLVLLLRS